jgi:hypothetical protein
MNEVDATEAERWRTLDREVQGLDLQDRQCRAQAVVDVAESTKRIARERGTNPLDDLLDLYMRVDSPAAKRMVADSMHYVKTELDLLKPRRAGGIAFGGSSQ